MIFALLTVNLVVIVECCPTTEVRFRVRSLLTVNHCRALLHFSMLHDWVTEQQAEEPYGLLIYREKTYS